MRRGTHEREQHGGNVMTRVTADITAQNTGTDFLHTSAGVEFDVDVGSTGAGTITLQRRRVGEATIYDVKTYSPGDGPEIGLSANTWEVRLFVKTGDYGSGTIVLNIWTA